MSRGVATGCRIPGDVSRGVGDGRADTVSAVPDRPAPDDRRGARLGFDPVARAEELWVQQWGEGSPHDAMAAATSVMRVQQLLLARFDAVLRPHGLTFARYEALVLLVFSRTGALPLSRVGERLMVHPTSVTNTVDRLERAGLVERVPNPRDGRGTLARVTDEGRAVVERATADLHAVQFGLTALDAGRRRELVELLADVRRAAGDFPQP
jgi:DNA-binding MarR family transcriptional regulator